MGEMNFCPPAPRRKRGRGGKAFPQFCVSRMPSGERKRWAGQSAKSSGFCSKKVLTSSSRHHHIVTDAKFLRSRQKETPANLLYYNEEMPHMEHMELRMKTQINILKAFPSY